jgi:hypothetical protein
LFITEKEFGTGLQKNAEDCIFKRFGSWENLLEFFPELFGIHYKSREEIMKVRISKS